MKRCPRCEIIKDSVEFSKNSRHKDGLAAYCKPCVKQYDHARHISNPIRRKAQRFNLTDEEYLALIERAGGNCELCGVEINQKRSAHIDHDHSCCPDRGRSCGKCIRGVLCSTCNTGLGCFRDDEELLNKAIAYLKLVRKN